MNQDFIVDIHLSTSVVSYAWIITPSTNLNSSNSTKAITDIAVIAKISPLVLDNSFNTT